MKVKKEKNELVIRIPLQTPTPSKTKVKTGKGADVVASSGGFSPTTVSVDGRVVKVSVNAII